MSLKGIQAASKAVPPSSGEALRGQQSILGGATPRLCRHGHHSATSTVILGRKWREFCLLQSGQEHMFEDPLN